MQQVAKSPASSEELGAVTFADDDSGVDQQVCFSKSWLNSCWWYRLVNACRQEGNRLQGKEGYESESLREVRKV